MRLVALGVLSKLSVSMACQWSFFGDQDLRAVSPLGPFWRLVYLPVSVIVCLCQAFGLQGCFFPEWKGGALQKLIPWKILIETIPVL